MKGGILDAVCDKKYFQGENSVKIQHSGDFSHVRQEISGLKNIAGRMKKIRLKSDHY